MHKSISKIVIFIVLAVTALGTAAAGRAGLTHNAQRYVERDSVTTACVHLEENGLIFPGSFKAITRFEKRLESLLRTHKGHLNIWHVGGSHVQADILSHRLRTNFARLAGPLGNRGMLFPFSMAKTNYGSDHRMPFTGTWTTARNIPAEPGLPLGITGMSAATTDAVASVTINLDNGCTPTWSFNALRVLAESSAAQDSVTLTLSTDGGDSWTLDRNDDGTFTVKGLPQLKTATLNIVNPSRARFLLRGIEPISTEQGTINYYSSGINGASTLSWLRCEHLDADLMRIKPDMVIFGIGINDAAIPSSKFEPETFESRYRRIIAKVLKANPDALLLFITNNDTFYKGQPNTNAIEVRRSFVKLATEYGGCVWDCYGVMGGLGSSTQWRDAGLMAKDRIHFSRKGYELLADLMFDALITDFVDNDE